MEQTYNSTNLPDRFLEPPIPAPHRFTKRNWKRNWSILAITLNWGGRSKGVYEDLGRWVARIDHQPKLSRQRIEALNKQTLWSLRQYVTLNFDRRSSGDE